MEATRPALDVLVVGNGVIGMSIAFELTQRAPELRVAVVGPTVREGAASAAAGAMLNCFAEVTTSTFTHPAASAKFTIAREALDAWPSWFGRLREAAGAAGESRSWTEGTFVLLGARAADQTINNFHAIEAALLEYEEPFTEVTFEDIEGMSPELNARPVRALHLHREGSVDAREILALLEKALERHNVQMVGDVVEGLQMSGGRVTGVRLAGGDRMAAGTVVLAAGSTTQHFIEQLPQGAVPPMLHGTGLAVQAQREAYPGFRHVVRTPNQAGACGLHLVPLAGKGLEYIGATNILSFRSDKGPGLGVAFNLLRGASEQLDRRLGNSSIQRWLHGRRPVALDGFPLIGHMASCGRLVFATGTYRDGLHSSPVIARHITDLILDTGRTDASFTHFAPERPPIEQSTVQGAIDDFVEHEIDASLILGIYLPYCVDPSPVVRHHRQTAESLYRHLEEPVALLPEVLNALNNEPDEGVRRLAPYLRAARKHHGAGLTGA
ncbi:NAD(P)/FAD-dependent oxidoreductase [Streptomyces sp. NPDC003016]